FFEANLHVVTKVFPALRLARVGPSAAKEILKNTPAAKHLAKHIERIMETASGESAGAPIERRVAVSIVSGPLLRVAKDFVGLAQFFELFLGCFIARIFVRMIFYGELAVSLLDFLGFDAFLDAENLVVVSFGHGS